MALKKSQLYSSLWSSCDELRGGMDASQYKDYVLTLLFMKYVSDKHAGKPGALIEVPAGGGFADLVAAKNKKEIGDRINKIIATFAKANDLEGVIDLADFNDEAKLGAGQEMQDHLTKLVGIFEGLDLRTNRAEGDDLLGDAYEYLMRHFATESGKSKGQFYTPAEVSRIMAQVVGLGAGTRQDQTIYDPTCGSGSLLLKAADEAPGGITIYGQEMDLATWALARMNMILHGHPTAVLWRGNTLSAPNFREKDGSLKTFDFAVANPPFSAKAWTSGLNPAEDQFKRFAYGAPPEKNGDYAFLLHLVASLKSMGKGAIILPHGVLFRGNKEADIRKQLVRRGLIKGIIGLPPNLFYGTGIPACVLVIDKEHAPARTGIFMIDASRGFVKDGNKNRLRAQDIHKIVDVFNGRKEVPGYSRMVPVSEVGGAANDYNLNLPRYIDTGDAEDLHDLFAHLNGGIPNRDVDALGKYWAVFGELRGALFQTNGRAGYSAARVEAGQVKATILAHGEFRAFAGRVCAVLDGWQAAHTPLLMGLKVNDLPRAIIRAISEDLLARAAELPLLDPYDVYQRLMDYWAEVMQDDVYLIAGDGWLEAAKPRAVINDPARKIKEPPDLYVGRKKYKMDLIPPALVVARFFAAEQSEIEALQAEVEDAVQRREEFEEEHGGDEGILSNLEGKGGITKGNVQDRVMAVRQMILEGYSKGTPEFRQAKAIKRASFGADPWTKGIADEADLFAELDVLYDYLKLADEEALRKSAHKEATEALQEAVLVKYAELAEEEIKALVVEDKWFTSIRAAVEGEVERVTQRLTGRVKDLEERYAKPLPALENEVETFSSKVAAHLKAMGVAWA